MKMVKTNVGLIPIAEYLDIAARQGGFEDYEDAKRNGVSISVSDADVTEE